MRMIGDIVALLSGPSSLSILKIQNLGTYGSGPEEGIDSELQWETLVAGYEFRIGGIRVDRVRFSGSLPRSPGSAGRSPVGAFP
jgi:hypothetical protein